MMCFVVSFHTGQLTPKIRQLAPWLYLGTKACIEFRPSRRVTNSLALNCLPHHPCARPLWVKRGHEVPESTWIILSVRDAGVGDILLSSALASGCHIYIYSLLSRLASLPKFATLSKNWKKKIGIRPFLLNIFLIYIYTRAVPSFWLLNTLVFGKLRPVQNELLPVPSSYKSNLASASI